MKVFVSIPQNSTVRSTFLPAGVRQYLEDRFEVAYSPFDRQLTPVEIREYAQDADAIMTGWGHCLLDQDALTGTSIRLIVHTGGSVGSLVNQETYEAGTTVLSGNNLYADSVAEGVLAYMLTALRKIPDYVNNIRAGGWHPANDYTEGLLDQTIGLVGMGSISKRVIKLLKPFQVKLKLYSSYPIDENFLRENNAVQTSLEEIFSTCKVISLHSALTQRSRGMIGREHFDLMQEGAVFINTARGAIVRENEMIEALKERPIHAILDVFCKEPLEPDNELRDLPNVYCISHRAGPTLDRRSVITRHLIDDMVRFENGRELQLEITNTYAARMTVQ